MPRRAIAIILSFLLIAGCAGTPAESATTTLSISPTAPPMPIPATVTKEFSSSESFPVVRIKNVETGTYLYDQDGQAQLSDILDASSLWVVEDYQGAKRFQNKSSGNYLSIEHLK